MGARRGAALVRFVVGERYGAEMRVWHWELLFAVALAVGAVVLRLDPRGAGSSLAALLFALLAGWLCVRSVLGTRPFG